MTKRSFIDRWEDREELNLYEYMDSQEGYIDFCAALNHVINFQKKITVEEISKSAGYTIKTIKSIMAGNGQRYSNKYYEIATSCGYGVIQFYKLGDLLTKGTYDPTADYIPTLDDNPQRNREKRLLEKFKNPSIAKEILKRLLKLEKINQLAFVKVVGVIDDEIQKQSELIEDKMNK